MTFPFLSVITFAPLVAGLGILLLPPERKDAARATALVTAVFTVLLSGYLYFAYDQAAGGFQFVEDMAWIPQLGIRYHMGVDGFSLPMLLLTGIVLMTGVMISWGIEDRAREYMSFFLILSVGVFGVFAALDLFLFFFLLEIAVFPKFLMIVVWGYPKTREYGGMKLTLYLFLASLVALVGVLALYANMAPGARSFGLLDMAATTFSPELQRWVFPLIFGGFAIMGAIFPLHSWAPDGHVAAPTAISMMLAGVEMKIGMYAALRLGVYLLPEGAKFWAPVIVAIALVNVIYAAYIALIQKDFKYIIGFSSVSHMGLVMLGFATLNPLGLTGAGLQMFSHGVMTALFFSIVGMVYDRAHTRMLPELGGMMQRMPWAGIAFLVAGFTSMGMPGFSGFVAEIPIYMGLWQGVALDPINLPGFMTTPWFFPLAAVIAALSIVITAAYILLAVRRVFFGELPTQFAELPDVTALDKVALGVLSGLMIVLGLYPAIMAPLVESGLRPVLQALGGG